ncbi:hypothetical protein DAPPUDRAFT_248438 [Daphnia pulex]|uniref:Uncharacterized protein n=1 Tax=Daphnia pulex TaxID=6669 RepID=E9GUN7_DAPPU|nr:hypothetical protein DAPPUDRAFT_248438 [Daphnia pulex]|eukprot:EFX76763.1 hypothetical protein DAPPUDRAFT_248438 [Daphnia pulex]
MNRQHGEVDIADAAFFARRVNRSTGGASYSSTQETSKPAPVFNYCDGFGRKSNHEESRFWKKKKDKKQHGDTRANIASSNQDWPPGYAFASLSLLSIFKKCNQTDWFADSGALQHVSDQLWQFQN